MSKKNDGLSLGYRFKWRLTWLLLHVAGPASLSDHLDPAAGWSASAPPGRAAPSCSLKESLRHGVLLW